MYNEEKSKRKKCMKDGWNIRLKNAREKAI